MKITSESFTHMHAIPDEFAFCVPDSKSHVALGRNRNPQLSWSEVPSQAKSLVLICVDPDDQDIQVQVVDPNGNECALEDLPEEIQQHVKEMLMNDQRTGADTLVPFLQRQAWGDEQAMLN